MRRWLHDLLIGFALGLAGWLAVAALHLEGTAVLVAPVAVGLVVGIATGSRAASARSAGLMGLIVGMAASYPVALAHGIIQFFGDGMPLYAVLLAILASAGFGLGVLARSVATRPPDYRSR